MNVCLTKRSISPFPDPDWTDKWPFYYLLILRASLRTFHLQGINFFLSFPPISGSSHEWFAELDGYIVIGVAPLSGLSQWKLIIMRNDLPGGRAAGNTNISHVETRVKDIVSHLDLSCPFPDPYQQCQPRSNSLVTLLWIFGLKVSWFY